MKFCCESFPYLFINFIDLIGNSFILKMSGIPVVPIHVCKYILVTGINYPRTEIATD